jgi:hypothetical protein
VLNTVCRCVVPSDNSWHRDCELSLKDYDRTNEDQLCASRVLSCLVDGDEVLLVCVGGDKEGHQARTGRDGYDDYVPAADHVVDRSITRGGAI